MKKIVIGVVGNPNCGKTTLFNALTGAKQRVGNWPGVTVERKSGSYTFSETAVEVIDTPGIYSLAASSLDEKLTRDYVLAREADCIVNIVDASNIERNLYLTSQLLEMQVPMIVALNMMDMAADRRLIIDVDGLARRLGCPVVPVTATKNQGIDDLRRAILEHHSSKGLPFADISYPEPVTEARKELVEHLATIPLQDRIDPNWLALKLLEGEDLGIKSLPGSLIQRAQQLREKIEKVDGEEADIVIASARYVFVSMLTLDLVKNEGQADTFLTDRIDRIVLHRFFGLPIFFAAMYLMFMFTINLGGAFIDFFDTFGETVFVKGTAALLATLSGPEWLSVVLANGIGGGLQTMATFIPPIGFMFLFLSLLEDSGYMARAAFVMDRFMRFIGLPGKAFVPMLVGFGCNVPAIMATRTLENERDRLLTIMMNPFMSCGARLPVYALFAVAFFPTGGQNMVFLLYLIGIGFAVLTGLVLKNTLLRGDVTPFIMEMPPYHLPTAKAILLRTYDRLQTFLFKAGKVLIPVIMVLSILNSVGTDGSFGNENTDKSTLAQMSKIITPVLEPMGVTADNWPATVGIFTGIFAKEAVVGTLDALYAGLDKEAAGEEEKTEPPFGLLAGIGEAFATIPENLAGLVDRITDPLGISIGEVSDTAAAAEEQEVNVATYSSMVKLFGGQAAAFAYLLFVLLYFPCSAAISAVYRETNLAWTAFAGFWTTFLAYLAATLFYQCATFAVHPVTSAAFIVAGLMFFAAVYLVMKYLGGMRRRSAPRTISTRLAVSTAGEK